MKAHAGKDLLLKLADAQAPEIFSTVAGLRTRSLSLNAQSIDITHSQSIGGWRELLEGGGVRQASIAGNGVFLDGAAAETVRAAFFAGAVRTWQIILPGFGRIEGVFQLTNLDYAGDYDGEITMALALESAGPLTFTPEGDA